MKQAINSLLHKIPAIIVVVLCYTLLCTQTGFAVAAAQQTQDAAPRQQQTPTTTAPPAYSSPEVEAQLRLVHAHTLFLMNAGTDNAFPTRAGDGYTRFANEMERWGRYKIVNNIADADLVIQFRAATTTTVVDGTSDSPQASVYHNPYFKVTVMDPATLQPIWPITIPVQTGNAKKTKEDLFALSVENATSQLKLLAGETLTKQEELAIVTTASASTSGSRAGMWIVLGTVALMTAAGIITPILMHNSFNDEVAKQKQEQLDFCKQYHIPNCPV